MRWISKTASTGSANRPIFEERTAGTDIPEKSTLADGRNYEVLRVVTPDPEVPEELIRYFIAWFGFDTYRKAVQEKLSGNGVVNVLATPSGAVCAYAFALKYFGEDILEFRFHPDYPEHLPELVRQTAADYEGMFDAVPVCAAAEDAELKLEALRRAGFSEAGGLPGRVCSLKSRI